MIFERFLLSLFFLIDYIMKINDIDRQTERCKKKSKFSFSSSFPIHRVVPVNTTTVFFLLLLLLLLFACKVITCSGLCRRSLFCSPILCSRCPCHSRNNRIQTQAIYTYKKSERKSLFFLNRIVERSLSATWLEEKKKRSKKRIESLLLPQSDSFTIKYLSHSFLSLSV